MFIAWQKALTFTRHLSRWTNRWSHLERIWPGPAWRVVTHKAWPPNAAACMCRLWPELNGATPLSRSGRSSPSCTCMARQSEFSSCQTPTRQRKSSIAIICPNVGAQARLRQPRVHALSRGPGIEASAFERRRKFSFKDGFGSCRVGSSQLPRG